MFIRLIGGCPSRRAAALFYAAVHTAYLSPLSVKERKKGGLGIFMVKKSMDNVQYEYKDGKNLLTITKNLN